MKEAFDLIKERLSTESDKWNDIWSNSSKGDDICDYADGKNDAFDEALSIVYEVEAEYGNGWIDVKDRLPENDGYYLTCDHKGNIHVFFHHQVLKETAPFGICEHHSQYYQPIAWMELPKPYKRKKGW